MKLGLLMWPINPVCTEANSRPAGPSSRFSGLLQLKGAAEESSSRGRGGTKQSQRLSVLTTQVPSGNVLIKSGALNVFVLVAFLTKDPMPTNWRFSRKQLIQEVEADDISMPESEPSTSRLEEKCSFNSPGRSGSRVQVSRDETASGAGHRVWVGWTKDESCFQSNHMTD